MRGLLVGFVVLALAAAGWNGAVQALAPPQVELLRPEPGALYVQGLRLGASLDLAGQPVGGGDAVVVGPLQVVARVTGPVAIAKVEFLVDGFLRATDRGGAGGAFGFLWEAGSEGLGTHLLEARAEDAAGRTASAVVRVRTVFTTAEGYDTTCLDATACAVASVKVHAPASALVAASGTGSAAGRAAASGTGPASGLAGVSGTGAASGHVALSGTGDATSTPLRLCLPASCSITLSGVPFSATGRCDGVACHAVEPLHDAEGYWLGASLTGHAEGAVAASGTGDAEASRPCPLSTGLCGVAAASGLGSSRAAGVAASGAGSATGVVAASGMGPALGLAAASGLGSAHGSLVAASGAGEAYAPGVCLVVCIPGLGAVSLLGGAGAGHHCAVSVPVLFYVFAACLAGPAVGLGPGGAAGGVAASLIGNANAGSCSAVVTRVCTGAAASVLGDSTAPGGVAGSGTGSASGAAAAAGAGSAGGGFVGAAGLGDAHGMFAAVAPGGDATGLLAVAGAGDSHGFASVAGTGAATGGDPCPPPIVGIGGVHVPCSGIAVAGGQARGGAAVGVLGGADSPAPCASSTYVPLPPQLGYRTFAACPGLAASAAGPASGPLAVSALGPARSDPECANLVFWEACGAGASVGGSGAEGGVVAVSLAGPAEAEDACVRGLLVPPTCVRGQALQGADPA